MPPKRPALASQAIALNSNSSHEDVLTFLSSVLTVAQFSKITDQWADDDVQPTGQILLNAPKSELNKLLLTNDVAKKVEQHLKAARQVLQEIDGSPAGAATTPLVDGPSAQEVDLGTDPGSSVPKPRARGRPSNGSRQSRLSQRLEIASAEDGASSDEEEEAAASDDETDADAAPVGRKKRSTRNTSRLAAVQRAAKDVKQVQDEFFLGDAEDDDDAPSDSESDEEVLPATRNGSRAARAARAAAAATAAAEQAVQVEDLPEEPCDGIHPDYRNCDWEDAVREGLVDILKNLPFDTLKTIVDDEFEGAAKDYYKYKYKSPEGIVQYKNRSLPYIAAKITKRLLDGWLKTGKADDGGTTWQGVDELLDKYVPEAVLKMYLDNVLKLRFATPPNITDTRRCLWRLWSTPVAKDGPVMASIGQITFPVRRIGAFLREHWDDVVENWEDKAQQPYMTTARVNTAFRKQDGLIDEFNISHARSNGAYNIATGQDAVGGIKPDPEASGSVPVAARHPPEREIVFEEPTENDPHDWEDLFEQLLNLQGRMNMSIHWRLDVPNKKVFGEVVADLSGNKGDVLVQAAFMKKLPDGEIELVQIWLDKILQAMDHLQGSELLEHDLEALNVAWDQSITDLEGRQVELTLEPPSAVNIRIFDQIMVGVENLERPMEAGVDAECRSKIALKLKPYQKRSLSFLLREERSPGGTSRHLWLKVPLPGNQPGVECYMSPSLFQLYISKSPTATGIALGNTGGGGWQALEMGMGKTAVIIAGIVMNPPPADWRKARPWTPYNPNDYMLTKTENMPRGGTLVVVPTTIVRQWEQEIEKTLKDPDEVKVLRWTDAHRTIDCNEIAQYDIVITTPQQVTKDSTMSSIYWHRIAVDEAQLNAGSMMQSGILLSTHRWIVSGTPCNAHPETLKSSLEFLRLGGYSDAQKHLPPALATVMRAVMCRYTMNGSIEGEKNLQLKALHQKVIPCELNDEDIEDEKEVGRQAFRIFSSAMLRGMKKCAVPSNVSIEELMSNRGALSNIAKSGHVKTLTMKRQMEHVRAVVAGGHHVLVPGQFVFNNRTQQDEPATRFFQSKAQYVTSCIVRIREADPEAKCIVFSQYEETLKSIGELLQSEGLTHRALYGCTSAKKRAEAIELFMTDPPTKVFLLAARSGAVGVTLTSANHVFICEPQMNPAVEAQAIGRSHRMGQEKQVTVHRFYTQNTIEERVRELIARKSNASGSQMVSTAMAANPGAGEVHCNLADYYNLLKVDLGDSDDEGEDVMVLN